MCNLDGCLRRVASASGICEVGNGNVGRICNPSQFLDNFLTVSDRAPAFRHERKVCMFEPLFRISGLVPRIASPFCTRWLKDGFLAIENSSTKGRSYRLADGYDRPCEATPPWNRTVRPRTVERNGSVNQHYRQGGMEKTLAAFAAFTYSL